MRNPHGPVVVDALSSKLTETGYSVIGSFCYGGRDIISTTPITDMKELAGRKIRVIESPTIVRTWRMLGANPTPLPAPEVYLGLQTKVIDALENPPSNYLAFKWYEVAKHFSRLGYLNTIMLISFAQSWLQKLPASHVDILRQTAAELSPQIFEGCQKDDVAALATTVKAGCQIHDVTDRNAWVETTRPIIQEFTSQTPMGRQLVDRIASVS